MFHSQRIHDECYRRPRFNAGQFVEEWDDEGARKVIASARWADRAWLIGCSENGFWDSA